MTLGDFRRASRAPAPAPSKKAVEGGAGGGRAAAVAGEQRASRGPTRTSFPRYKAYLLAGRDPERPRGALPASRGGRIAEAARARPRRRRVQAPVALGEEPLLEVFGLGRFSTERGLQEHEARVEAPRLGVAGPRVAEAVSLRRGLPPPWGQTRLDPRSAARWRNSAGARPGRPRASSTAGAGSPQTLGPAERVAPRRAPQR